MRRCRLFFALTFALLISVLAAGCGGRDTGLDTNDTNVFVSELTREELLGQLARLETPAGADVAAFDGLKSALRAELEDGPARWASKAPEGQRNAVNDLVFTTTEGGAQAITWTYRNVGDYDLNGIVAINDLTPLGGHLGKTPTDSEWLAKGQFADGDGNEIVTISDLTPIGANLLTQLASYRVEGAASAEGPWTELDTVSLDSGEKIIGNMRSYTFEVEGLGHSFYRVVPLDATGQAGEPSSVAQELALHDNAVTADAEHGFTFVSFDGTTLVLEVSGDADVKVGDVVAGTDGGGFLVHAESVERNGSTLTITTSQASLADYILSGEVTAEVEPEGAPAQAKGGSAASRTASFLLEYSFTPVNIEDRVLYDANGIAVTADGVVSFSPRLYCHAEFQSYVYLKYLEAWADGTLHWDLQLDITGDYRASFGDEWSPGRLDLPVGLPIAPGVNANMYLDFKAGFEANGEFHGHSSFGSERTYNMRVGLLYNNGNWTNLSTAGTPVENDKPFTIDTFLAGNVRGYIAGEVGITVNGVLGAGLTLTGDVAASVTHSSPPEQFNWNLTGGLDLGYNAWARVWNWRLFDQSDSIVGTDIALGSGVITPGGSHSGESTGTWRQAGGDQFKHGYVDYVGPTGATNEWTAFGSFSSGLRGNAASVGDDGTVYIGGESGYLYAFNPDGSEKWKYDMGVNAKIYSAPAVTDSGTVYFGSIAPSGLYAIQDNGASASLKWSFTEGNPSVQGSPTIDADGTVYFGTTDPFNLGGQMKVFALTDNGGSYTKKWEVNVAGPVYGAPAVWNNGTQSRVYVGLAEPGNGVAAITYDGFSAFQDWTYDAQGGVLGSPVIDKDDFPHNIIFGSLAGKVFCCDYNGDDVFSEPFVTDFSNEVRATPAVDPVDGSIYVGDVGNVLYALTPAGTPKWEYVAGGQILGAVVLDSERRVFFAATNALYGIRDFTDHGEEELLHILGGAANACPALDVVGGKPRAYVVGGSNLHCVFK